MKLISPNALISVAFFILLSQSPSFAQLVEIDNKLPDSVPIALVFEKYDRANWWQHLEIKVKKYRRETDPLPLADSMVGCQE